MSNEVFGVNVVEVEEQVKHLIEVYKTSGKSKKATLKAWGHKMNEPLYGSDALTRKFLNVLFEEKSDWFIIRVLEAKNPNTLWRSEVKKELRAEDPSKWDVNLMGHLVDLAESWAVYNLPVLQEMMDALVDSFDKHPAYLDGCYALEDMMEDIKDNGGFDRVPCFQSYVAPYIIEYLENYDLENLLFLNDEGEVEDVDLDYLDYIWSQFCNTELCEDILHDWYCSFMVDAVREVVSRANV